MSLKRVAGHAGVAVEQKAPKKHQRRYNMVEPVLGGSAAKSWVAIRTASKVFPAESFKGALDAVAL